MLAANLCLTFLRLLTGGVSSLWACFGILTADKGWRALKASQPSLLAVIVDLANMSLFGYLTDLNCWHSKRSLPWNRCSFQMSVASNSLWALGPWPALHSGRCEAPAHMLLAGWAQPSHTSSSSTPCTTWSRCAMLGRHSHSQAAGACSTPHCKAQLMLELSCEAPLYLYIHSRYRWSGQAQPFCCLSVAPALQQLPASQACTVPCCRPSMAPLAYHGAVLR